MKFLILMFALFTPKFFAHIIECDFVIYSQGQNQMHYTCVVENVTRDDNFDQMTIEGFKGEHFENFTDSDVTEVQWKGSQSKKFPENLIKLFPNLKSIEFTDSNLEEINREDLEPFGEKLENLNLCRNKIQVLKSDLFHSTLNLKRILLAFNDITKVEEGAFQGLNNLNILSMSGNECSGITTFSGGDIQGMIEKMYKDCK